MLVILVLAVTVHNLSATSPARRRRLTTLCSLCDHSSTTATAASTIRREKPIRRE
jgi:hypothetical protein